MPDFRLLSQDMRLGLPAVTGSQQRPVSAPHNRVPSLFFGALGTSSPNVDDVKHMTALVDHMIDGH